jgi:hypothetical protein
MEIFLSRQLSTARQTTGEVVTVPVSSVIRRDSLSRDELLLTQEESPSETSHFNRSKGGSFCEFI